MGIGDPGLERLRDEVVAAIRDSETRIRGDVAGAILASEARLETRLGSWIGSLDARIDGLDTRLEGLDTRIGGLDTRVDGLETRVDETRRHFDVVVEDFRSQVRTVAEGLVMAHERLRDEMRDGFAAVDRRLLRLEIRVLPAPERG